MKSDKETYSKITSEDLKNYQRTRSYPNCALPSPTEAKNQSLCREDTLPRDEKRTLSKKTWIESDARFGPCLGQKVCKTHGRYSVEVKVPPFFEDQTTSWTWIVNGVEKYVKEAMPIQEEGIAWVEPAAKAKTKVKPSSTSNWNFIPMAQRKWIDIEGKRSKDPYCFQMSKFITQVLRHKEAGPEGDAGFPCDRIDEKCKEVLSEDSRYWSDEAEQKLSMASCWSTEKCVDVLSKGGGQKKRFPYCSKPICPETLLFLQASQVHSGKAHSGKARINPALQDNVLSPKDFTKYV